MPQVLLLLVKVRVKEHALLQQWLCKLGKSSLNLGVFNANFKTTKYFKRNKNIKKLFFPNF